MNETQVCVLSDTHTPILLYQLVLRVLESNRQGKAEIHQVTIT